MLSRAIDSLLVVPKRKT